MTSINQRHQQRLGCQEHPKLGLKSHKAAQDLAESEVQQISTSTSGMSGSTICPATTTTVSQSIATKCKQPAIVPESEDKDSHVLQVLKGHLPSLYFLIAYNFFAASPSTNSRVELSLISPSLGQGQARPGQLFGFWLGLGFYKAQAA